MNMRKGRKSRVKIGGIYESAKCGTFEVVEYNDSKNIVVKFLTTGYVTTTASSHILRGSVADPLFPCVNGFYMGDKYPSTIGGEMTRAYKLWAGMKHRCYGESRGTASASYRRKGTTVCDEWKCYTAFHDWVIDQGGHELDNYDLDKDLKRGNEYSPEYCVFLPKPINVALQFGDIRNGASGLLPGVRRTSVGCIHKYSTRIMVDNKEKYLGTYETQEEAHLVYKNAKARWVSTLAERYRAELPREVYDLLVYWHPDDYSTPHEPFFEYVVKI